MLLNVKFILKIIIKKKLNFTIDNVKKSMRHFYPIDSQEFLSFVKRIKAIILDHFLYCILVQSL